MRVTNGAELVVDTLEQLGVSHVFGLPGTQNVQLFDALRRSPLRTIVTSDEMAAAFAACGYARASGRVGVVTTIPGPGFTYALTALAEAHADSAPLLLLTLRQPDTGKHFQLQRIDQATIAAPLAKSVQFAEDIATLGTTIEQACADCLRGEPGPVLLEIAAHLMTASAQRHVANAGSICDGHVSALADAAFNEPLFEEIAVRLDAAARPLLFAGQGAQGAQAAIRKYCAARSFPVLTTCSGRGVINENHALALPRDFSFGLGRVVPEVIAEADLILVLGCKFAANGAAGFTLRLPEDRLIKVDSSSVVLNGNYPARWQLVATCEEFMARLLRRPSTSLTASSWGETHITELQRRLAEEREQAVPHEPVQVGVGPVRQFLRVMSKSLPDDSIITTDSGFNQALTRHYITVRRARGVIAPTDFQSMGFGLPAALGAALAAPATTIVACIGDGGLMQTATEMLTARREDIALTIVVFNDGMFGYIQRQQIDKFGVTSGIKLGNVDLAALTAAFDCEYFDAAEAMSDIARIAALPGVKLIDLKLHDPASVARQAVQGRLRESTHRALGPRIIPWLKRLLKR